jgi:hypothetical protein
MRVLTAVCTASLIWLTGIVTAVSAAAQTPTNTATVGTSLAAGSQLTSASRAYETVVQHDGNVVTYGPRGVVWNTATHGTAVRLAVQHDGNVVVYAGSRAVWNSRTSQSGASNRLTLTNSGVLELIGKYGIVWSSRIGNRCGSNGAARAVLVSVHDQLAGFCEGSRQVLTSPVTTGASALGDGTPLGSWAVYAKVRDTWLYPAGGGAYFVHYWMPYSGAYGVHDSPWQSFAYGSQQYVTRGSHGCIHLPGSVMAWFYGWAPVGTAVRVTA